MWQKNEILALLACKDLPRKLVLEAFFHAPYWRRVWIVQEFLLARTLLFISDSRTLSWDVLHTKLGRWNNVREWNVPFYHFAYMAIDRRIHFTGSRQRYRDLISQFWLHECSDERDKVYGLLALVDWTDFSEPIKPDYSLSPGDLRDLINSTWILNRHFSFDSSSSKSRTHGQFLGIG
jgi:hypothetical protein